MAITDESLASLKQISMEQVRLLRRSRGATNETLAKLPEAGIQRAIRRFNYPDMPRARQAFRVVQSRNDDGRVPANGLGKALKELKAIRRKTGTRPRVAGVPTDTVVQTKALMVPTASAGMTKAGWEWLGPGNVGGRTRAIVVHPKQPDRLWAASVAGGIWFSDNGGKHWEPVDDFMANLAVTCMVMDPRKPQVMYAGTGEGFFNLDAVRGAGIFCTRDGVKWGQLASTTSEDFSEVNRLAISRTGNVLLAAVGTGLFRSADAARKTWVKVLDGAMADVRFDPRSSLRAVAGSLDKGQAFYTTNGGKTWKEAMHATPWEGRVELTYSAKSSKIIYASVQMTAGEIWRSDDGGKTYKRRGNLDADGRPAEYLGDQGWYDNAIWAGDPKDENLVIVGGIDLWKSTDGGDTLREISTWWDSGSVHADHHAIVSHPGYDGTGNRTVFFGNDGGIYKADDIAKVGVEPEPPFVSGWTELVNNYGVTQFYGGAGNATSGRIVAGAQDNGTVCYDPAQGIEQWRTIFGGDGGYCAADPTDPNVFYGEYVYLNIHRNTDGGTSDDTAGDRYISGQFWNNATRRWEWKSVPFTIPDAMNRRALFIAPFVLDPNTPNRVLGGGLSLWQTNDAKAANTPTSGPSWRAIKTGIGKYISALAVATGDSDLVWVGHENGAVYKSANATAAQPVWQRVDGVGPKPLSTSRLCACITIHPKDKKVVYVGFGGYQKDNVWVTKDGGSTWSDLGASLPAAPVRAIAIHPGRPGFVYLGTEVGLFASEDGGNSWSPTNEGPTNCSVEDLFWLGEKLICATHGRGMYRIDLSTI